MSERCIIVSATSWPAPAQHQVLYKHFLDIAWQMWLWLDIAWKAVTELCAFDFCIFPNLFTYAFVFQAFSCLKILFLLMESDVESSSDLFVKQKTRAKPFCIANQDAFYLLWFMWRTSFLQIIFKTYLLLMCFPLGGKVFLVVISHADGNETEQSCSVCVEF